jgi:hypothetical protein
VAALDIPNQQAQIDLTNTINNLPFCDQEFTGTVKVNAGGVNVTGVSIFNDNVGIDGDLAISGEFSANQVNTAQGISAHGGKIFLGNPDGTSFFDGITLGGGALGGAGFGGATAFTGDVSAIAIGNGASAATVNSLALGTGANAAFANSAAYGANAMATRSNQQMFGTAINTYTMPGITSTASRASQTGRLEVATTDAAGNLATDGGDIFNAIARVQAGVAIAMAIETPELSTGENFGIRFGWGGFDSF